MDGENGTMIIRKTLPSDRARAILEAYGADPARWPVDERRAMRRALERDPDLQGAAREMVALDGVLSSDRGAPDTSALQARILAAAPDPAERHEPFSARGRIPAFAAAAALIVGSLAGFGGAFVAPSASDPAADIIANAFSDPDAVFEIELDAEV